MPLRGAFIGPFFVGVYGRSPSFLLTIGRSRGTHAVARLTFEFGGEPWWKPKLEGGPNIEDARDTPAGRRTFESSYARVGWLLAAIGYMRTWETTPGRV
jgi:hypothetical protein